MAADVALDRLAMRTRPPGEAVMGQRWDKILFLHWPIEQNAIRHLVPPALEIDTFDHSAWIGITPFRMCGLRVPPIPPIPFLDSFDEINVRTYVHYEGRPGIYFFSLDASKLVPALAARLFYQLPYFAASITSSDSDGTYHFDMKRDLNPETYFRAKWQRGLRLRAPDLDSLGFFLIERYGFFVESAGTVQLTRAYHSPWILEEALVEGCESTLVRSLGLPEPSGEPLAHFSQGNDVQIWLPVTV